MKTHVVAKAGGPPDGMCWEVVSDHGSEVEASQAAEELRVNTAKRGTVNGRSVRLNIMCDVFAIGSTENGQIVPGNVGDKWSISEKMVATGDVIKVREKRTDETDRT